ncbi:hypothetical protein [Paludibaculum fermentans]|uniref:Uncharacterized protein n=1 Tax=Paludibaculum fermentans TaxID=1473598 RepID=A0A7S7NMQ3_PALFE|nr:hypothetical protein [Paludibaculum fermentans]QOY86458.1 hypothetical protein IRI77_27175 [Paludibaculum fermentans]
MKNIFRVLLLAAAVTLPAAYGQYSTPVREVEKPDKRPVTISYGCTSAASCTNLLGVTIPAGSRLVLEYVSAFISPSPANTGSRALLIQVNGQNHYIPAKDLTFSGQSILSETVKIYCDTMPYVAIAGGSVGTTVDITLTGYFATK